MRSIIITALVAARVFLYANAYLDVEEGAMNVRHFHMIERSEDGDIGESSRVSSN